MAEPLPDTSQAKTTMSQQAQTHSADVSPNEAPSAPESTASAAVAHQGKKKRRRPALSCEQCRRRKIRCDRLQPCSHCIKSGIPDCHYVPTHIPASWAKKAQQAAAATEQPPAPAPAPPPVPRTILPAPKRPSPEYEGQELEFCMIKVLKKPSSAPSSVAASGDLLSVPAHDWAASVHFLEDKLSSVSLSNSASPSSHREDEPSGPKKANAAKTRYFGPSHWLRSTALLMAEKDLFIGLKNSDGDFWQMMDSCKSLARAIKEKRHQPISSLELGLRIPSRDVADALVDAYLRSFEGVIRILHVPTFRAEYEQYWAEGPASCQESFIIQLQLVMAIGAAMQDDVFSLRAAASQWLHEAQLWLMLPPEKSRMTVAGLQIMCLVTLARSVCSLGHELAWVTAGELIRKAMYMGLHHDPQKLVPNMPTYRAEMRRRLWATIMELNLQSSFDAGGPTLISPKDYDVLPPADLDDEELEDESSGDEDQSPANSDSTTSGVRVTSMSVPLELFRSLPIRMALLAHANGDRAEDDYDKVLHLNSDLTKACRTLSRNLARLVQAQKDKTNSPPKVNDFHTSVSELLVYRCFTTLHQPFVMRSLEDPRLYFSRKMYLDSAIKIATICGLAGPGRANGPGGTAPGAGASDFHRLMTNSSGAFRNIPLQAIPGVIFELTVTTGENDDGGIRHQTGLGYFQSTGDYDLHATVDSAARWMLRRMRAGETNIKGYLACGTGRRHVAALEAGLDRDGVREVCREAMGLMIKEAYQVLRELAVREGVQQVEENYPVDGGAAAGVATEPAETTGNAPAEEDDFMAIDLLGDWTWDGMDQDLWTYPSYQNGGSMFA